jgi:hypothetical protein
VDAVSLDALTGAATGWPLVAVVLSYAVFPYAVLWLAVRLWPKGHPRRAELLAEYDAVDIWMRPLWVGDVAIRCLLDGLAERVRSGGATRGRRIPTGLIVVGTTALPPATYFATGDSELSLLLIAAITSVLTVVAFSMLVSLRRSVRHVRRSLTG